MNFVRRGTYRTEITEMPPWVGSRGGRAGGAGRGLRHTPGRGRAGAIGHPEPSITGGASPAPRGAAAGAAREPAAGGGGERPGAQVWGARRREESGSGSAVPPPGLGGHAGARTCPQTAAQHRGGRC